MNIRFTGPIEGNGLTLFRLEHQQFRLKSVEISVAVTPFEPKFKNNRPPPHETTDLILGQCRFVYMYVELVRLGWGWN